MVLEKDEYRIEGDGIWISKAVLEECRDHYNKVADGKHLRQPNNLQKVYFIGKADVYRDLLKHFEPLEED